MKKFYNTNEKYGEAGPFEAESKSELAAGMISTFMEWANDKAVAENMSKSDELELIAEMAAEFEAGLTEIE